MKNVYSTIAICAAIGLATGCTSNKTVDEVIEAPQTVEVPEVIEQAPQVVDERPVYIDTTFYFEFDSARLTSGARASLMLHAEQLSDSPRAIRLEGHADERGSREYNMALGERRANAVRNFLILQGVRSSMIETVSYGEEQPQELGSREGAWSKNRRVELK